MSKSHLRRITFFTVPLVLTVLFGFNKLVKPFKLPKSVKKQFSFIQAGKVFNGKDTAVTNDFYISKYEVSNKEYNNFLNSLKKQGKIGKYNIAKIDTNNWSIENKNMLPFVKTYHRHPAYDNYPVVNISIEGARLYCEWMTTKLNSENPQSDYTITIRLPNRNEWLKAANGNNIIMKYAWGRPYLRNYRGQLLCNFKSIGEENVSIDKHSKTVKIKNIDNKNVAHYSKNQYLNDSANIASPVDSYFPSSLGIYNLNGNVAELVTDKLACGGSWNSYGYDVRNLSTIDYEKPSCFIGFRPILTIVKK